MHVIRHLIKTQQAVIERVRTKKQGRVILRLVFWGRHRHMACIPLCCAHRACIDILPDALEPRGIGEVGRANCLAHNIPVAASRCEWKPLLLHNVQELRAHL
jgi:hypothetical protein